MATTSYRYKNLFSGVWHPTDRELFLYVNGELAPKTAERIDSHLESCWPCGVKKDRWAGSISAFMEYHGTALGSSSEPPPEALSCFEAKLKRMTSQPEKPLFRLLDALTPRRWPPLSTKLAAGLAAVLLVAFLMSRWTSVSPVSANEVLQRSQQAEEQRIQGVPGPVVYQKLRVRRRSSDIVTEETVTWETWNDVKSGRSRQRADGADGPRPIDSQKDSPTSTEQAPVPRVLAELRELLRDNHLDSRRPLSAFSYEVWRRSIQNRTEQVSETTLPDGRAALTVTTVPAGPIATNGVTRAELVVLADTWHPVEQRLAAGNRSYELTETNFEVLALSSLGSSFFADITSPAPHRPFPKGPQLSPAPSLGPVELVSREIEAHYALHRLRACLGEQVEVKSDPIGGVTVRGLVSNADRKEELLWTLKSLPRVTAQIQTVEEALNSKPVQPESLTAQGEETETLVQTEVPVQVRTGESPTQNQLERYFAKVLSTGSPQRDDAGSVPTVRERIMEFSNQTASLTQAALSEAWALRRLAEWYPALKTNSLPSSAKWLLENMLQDHRTALKEQLAQWRKLLTPVLLTIVGNQATSSDHGQARPPGIGELSGEGWTAESLRLFQSLDQMERLTLGWLTALGLQTAEGAPQEPAEESARRLLAAFGQAEIGLQELARALGKEFSGNPELLSVKEPSDGRRSH
ncbi:MAG: zf-HC2 domain-containing protein [Acidobacteria bacterium]|nr:zf-HC2 domain-containing protein [Acidobacteriota bacterium]